MTNLFFIHTPLQLMVAQMIIEQERLDDNVMLCGYVDNNRNFLSLYDIIRIDRMWNSIEYMNDIARWGVFSRKKLISGCVHAYLKFKQIIQILKRYHVETVFLGDMTNASYQLTALSFHKKGVKVCFFEEGSGHYLMDYNYGKKGTTLDKIYSILIDIFYYRPFYGTFFTYFYYWEGSYLEFLPMDARYSIIPFYHESFDKLITTKLQLTNEILDYISKELVDVPSSDNILMLTSPFYVIHGNNDDPSLYIKVIVDTLRKLDRRKNIWIKFHPREKQEVSNAICIQLDSYGVNYRVLGKTTNLPVEYYFNIIHFDKVFMFLCSSSFYNGYLFPYIEFVSIMEPFYSLCKAEGSEIAKYIEYLIKNSH